MLRNVERFVSPCGRWVAIVDLDTSDVWRTEKLSREAAAAVISSLPSWSRLPHHSAPVPLSLGPSRPGSSRERRLRLLP